MHDAMPLALIKKILVLALSSTVAMGLCSCSKPDIRQTASRIAAPVNGEEIHQIDSAFARNNNMTSDQAGRAATLARDRVIDQELLVQAALESRLNRDAQVARAIERARRQILAQAYLERATISASKRPRRKSATFTKKIRHCSNSAAFIASSS